MSIAAKFNGWYATRIYLPASDGARRWRCWSRRVRGKQSKHSQVTRLPSVHWSEVVRNKYPSVWQARTSNGNVRISEVAILAASAADVSDSAVLFEIGTFDGRTTLNLALSAPLSCRVHTLDLLPEMGTERPLEEGERHMVDKPASGERYQLMRGRFPHEMGRIEQHFGDSATFDFTPYAGRCALVFVDGSHAYEYVLKDSATAFELVKPGGLIFWHDYGVWSGVTRGLEEIEQRESRGLRGIRGTSLVVWRAPERQ